MSSVGSSDSSGSANRSPQDEVIRRNREDARANESELVKKHQREIRRLNEEHYAELEKLKEEHQSQMESLRKLSGDEISERDHKYQQEIDEMRGLYKKQLQDQADDTVRRDENIRSTSKTQLEQERTNNDARFSKLNEDYKKDVNVREKSYEEALIDGRNTQKEALSENHEKLTSKHKAQEEAIVQERNRTVGNLQKTYADYRRSSDDRLREQELRTMEDKQRSSQALLQAVEDERAASEDSKGLLRDGFREDQHRTRERYDEAMAKERSALNMSQENMKSSVRSRIDNDINRLKQDKERLKDANVRQEVLLKQKMQNELKDVRDSYQKNMDSYKGERDEAVRDSNDRTHRSVETVRKEMGQELTSAHRFYRGRQEELNRINRDAYDNLKGDFESRNEGVKQQTDLRVKRVLEKTEEDKARMSEMQVENHDSTQHSHQDDMKQLRYSLDAEKQLAVNNLQDMLQKQELQHSDRMAQTVAKYEKQIQLLKDQLIHEKKSTDDTTKRSIEELQKVQKLNMDQVQAQQRDRLRMMSAQHADELRTMNKRNDEKMDQLISQLKKS